MKLGFIGTGNMAGAIMGGIIGQGIIPASEIIGSDVFAAGREKVKEQYGIHVTADNKEVVEKADRIYFVGEAAVLCVRDRRNQGCCPGRSDHHHDRTGKNARVAGGEIWQTGEDRPYDAEYAGYGRRGDDRGLRK